MADPTIPAEPIVSDAEPAAAKRRPSCDCLELLNKALIPHNTHVGEVFSLRGGVTRVEIATYLNEKKRGARPANMVAEFCPFCGVRYEWVEAAAEAAS